MVTIKQDGTIVDNITVLDVYTRIAIEQIFQKSVRKIDVINVF